MEIGSNKLGGQQLLGKFDKIHHNKHAVYMGNKQQTNWAAGLADGDTSHSVGSQCKFNNKLWKYSLLHMAEPVEIFRHSCQSFFWVLSCMMAKECSGQNSKLRCQRMQLPKFLVLCYVMWWLWLWHNYLWLLHVGGPQCLLDHGPLSRATCQQQYEHSTYSHTYILHTHTYWNPHCSDYRRREKSNWRICTLKSINTP